MNKTIQNLKMEIESIKKSKTMRIQDMRNLKIQTGNIETSFTNRIYHMEDRFKDIEDMIKVNVSVKEKG